jgi:hypothetical protein
MKQGMCQFTRHAWWIRLPLTRFILQGLDDSMPVLYTERHGSRRFPLRLRRWRFGINRVAWMGR